MATDTHASRLRGRTTVDDPFDRQRRITDWKQDVIENAKVLVLGAGAIGNETIKNLTLIGLSRLLICDFDTIETSNLSRTVLFKRTDVGLRKAQVAAESAQSLSLSSNPAIEWFDGDVVWDLGLHVISEVDLILGCLDNVEARRAMNTASRKLGIPYIDAGIRELSATVAIFAAAEGEACYECGLSAQQLEDSRQRYSCDNAKKAFVQSARVPTVQISAAMAGAMQAQEAVRWLSGDRSMSGSRLTWIGETNEFRRTKLTANPACRAHLSLPAITVTPLSAGMQLGQFLDDVEQFVGAGPIAIDLAGERTFVERGNCRTCGSERSVRRPLFRLTDQDLECLERDVTTCETRQSLDECLPPATPTTLSTRCRFSRLETPELCSLTLNELGIPLAHIVPLTLANGEERCVALQADRPSATRRVVVD